MIEMVLGVLLCIVVVSLFTIVKQRREIERLDAALHKLRNQHVRLQDEAMILRAAGVRRTTLRAYDKM